MAIYHFESQIISRGEGRSAVAAAAYRHAARMEFEREDRVADFSNKKNVAHSEFMAPADAPEWLHSMMEDRSAAEVSEAFWNTVEDFEKRCDAQLSKEFVLALPKELTKDQNIELVREFIGQQMLSRGMVADWVYHDVEANPHVHIMTTLRPLTQEGFGSKKVPVLDKEGNPQRGKNGKIQYRLWAGDRGTLNDMRAAWAQVQNAHLAQYGIDARVDHRSYAEQGIDLTPQGKIGVRTRNIAKEALAQGREVDLDRMALHEDLRRDNAARIARRPEIVIDAVSREKSVFDERDIAKHLHRWIDDGQQFQNLLAQIMASPELVMLAGEGVDFDTGEVRPAQFATREMVRIEDTMSRQAAHLSTHGSFGAEAHIRNEVLANHRQLSDEQRNAIELATGNERLALIVGRAGAGKTTMMKAAREIWEASGYRVVGGALAGKAAEGLQKEAGIESRTLASWALQWEQGHLKLDDKTVFVMDEAGMVSSRQMADFISAAAHAGAKIVLVGDADQLQPIEAGGAFRALSEQIGFAELSTIYRQREQWMRDASMALARGNVSDALAAYQEKGHIIEKATKDEAIASMVADWVADYDPNRTTLMMAFMRKDVAALNALAREGLRAKGLIEEGHAFRTANGVRNFAAGDQIVFLENEGSLGVMNGMIGRVVEADRGKIIAEVGEDKRRVEIEQHIYSKVDHGYATTIHKSQGVTIDKVKVLASSMFDRHLTYVALTRHRDEVQLYAGADEFKRSVRVDHAAGVTGQMIDAGEARFHDREDARPTPYVDLRDPSGITHRLWGVTLPEAIRKADARIGDTITLRRNGIEEVTVKVAVKDEATGEKRFEERLAERNVWSANVIEAGDPALSAVGAEVLFSRPGKVDHAQGVTGELVEKGEAPFGDDPHAKPTPFADVKTPDGVIHRLWGVALPQAIGRAGAETGDTVSLRRAGTEEVTVKVPVRDAATGATRIEERDVERNVWEATRLEAAADRAARLAREPEKSVLFGQLVARMSRSAAKSTTLDFVGSKLYGQAVAYATRRGLHSARIMKAAAVNQTRWLARQRDRLAAASRKLAAFVERFGLASTNVPQATPAPSQPWLRGRATWRLSIPQAVEAKMQSDAQLTVHWTQIQDRMKNVYEKPQEAMASMGLEKALQGDRAAAEAISDQLGRDPEAYGPLRGKAGLFASSAAKAERDRAINNVPALRDQIGNYVRLRAEIADLRTVELSRERDLQRIDVPAISSAGNGVLERVRDAIDRNDIDSGMAYALADKMVKGEIDRLNKSLDEKFGKRAFASKEPSGPAFEAAASKVAEGDRSKLAAAWPLFHASQQIAAHEQKQARQQVRAQTQTRDQGMTR
ncbi:Ti-type conjugative transfer relaxase TraA [Mesorhizobium sp. YIM 152430]|uniref:Ti-type conjugative transfer relaxase TraA n=2 Tax=Mesorhizobium sp. YIM 152430 TaxID=3031761 RepID=UPI0023DA7E89|nr:Ti-type conjugative transfer relaxase TraA [Mesorhizobium sp. YIM 152430]MDF1600343.1 Ti-type conjugative transfer relaxase TraA [Mesorhizobium sp. YIM 152430]